MANYEQKINIQLSFHEISVLRDYIDLVHGLREYPSFYEDADEIKKKLLAHRWLLRERKIRIWDHVRGIMHYLNNSYDSICFDKDGQLHYYNLQNDSGSKEYTLMDFVGLKDCAEKEIYEADLCKTREGISEVVYWNYGYWLNGVDYSDIILLSSRNAEVKVVGNIFEGEK